MIKTDYILMILNCKKYQHKAELQKQGWLTNIELFFNLKYFHVIGDKELCKDKEYIFDFENKIIYVNTADDYMSLPAKVITGYKAINETFDYKYILKTDDDQMLYKEGEFSKIIFLLEKQISYYGGKIWHHNGGIHLSPNHPEMPKNIMVEPCTFASGRFYYLHKDLVKNILTKFNIIKHRYLEDHAVGFYIDKNYKQTMVYIDTDLMFKDIILSNNI